MKKREFLHQGDVQILGVDSIPSDAKRIEKKPIALGELSGHEHVITGDYELFEDEKTGFIFAAVGSDGASLQHIHESNFTSFDTKISLAPAEHKEITLKPNKTYKFGIHKKFNPFKKIFEKVLD